MGIEYVAALTRGQKALDLLSLFARVCAQGDWIACERTPRRLSLRYAGVPERSHWPEDVVIDGGNEELYVLVHSGTEMQRSRLLRFLAEACSEQGVATSFEEP